MNECLKVLRTRNKETEDTRKDASDVVNGQV